MCRQLSLWWTKGQRDDLYWRTAGSGAMAKTRSKTHLKTYGQYGDIQATDPQGEPLLKLMSLELKRGYNKANLFDLIDNPAGSRVNTIEEFLNQAITDAKNSKAFFWSLIYKRDRKEALIFVPKELFMYFQTVGLRSKQIVRLTFPLRFFDGVITRSKEINPKTKKRIKHKKITITETKKIALCVFPIVDFFRDISCDNIKTILQCLEGNNG
jgi:hypothetical protein